MKRKIEIKEVFRGMKAAFPSTVPIFFGWIFVALTYGVLMEELGYGPLWTLLFSMICFCGGMQIAAVPMMAAGFDPVLTGPTTPIMTAPPVLADISL